MEEKRKKEYRVRDMERIMKFRLLDDIFMKEVLRGNINGVQDIIRIILRRDDITVREVTVQDELSNLVGHGVRVDVLARDERGKFYDIEIQRAGSGAGARRARYNLGAVDWHKLPPGTDYDELAETWIIFITETDVFHRGLPVYTVNRFIEETGEAFNDGAHIVYANAAYVGDDDFGRLMADFRETDPKKMNFPSLAEKARQFKQTEGGVESMCRVMEEVREEGIEIGEKRKRNQMIDALVLHNSEESLLHSDRFAGLNITKDEIEASRRRLSIQ